MRHALLGMVKRFRKIRRSRAKWSQNALPQNIKLFTRIEMASPQHENVCSKPKLLFHVRLKHHNPTVERSGLCIPGRGLAVR